IEQQIIPMFGAEWDENDLLKLQELYEKEVAEADAYLANDPEAVAVGMDRYEKFNYYDDENEEQSAYHAKIVFESDLDFPWRLQAYEWYITENKYREKSITAAMNEASEEQKTHISHPNRFSLV